MARRIRSKYNWTLIKQIYIYGKRDMESWKSNDYTFGEIAKMFNIAASSSVKRRADREGWDRERNRIKRQEEAIIAEEYEKAKLAELPTIVEFRRRALKVQLGTITRYLEQLNEGTVDVRPSDADRALRFILEQYHVLYGVQPPEEPKDGPVEDEMELPEIYERARDLRVNRIRRRDPVFRTV